MEKPDWVLKMEMEEAIEELEDYCDGLIDPIWEDEVPPDRIDQMWERVP